MTWTSFAKRMLALPVLALAGAYIIMVIWTHLVLHDYIDNATFAWFPTVAIIWSSFCLVACALAGWPEKQSDEPDTSSQEE